MEKVILDERNGSSCVSKKETIASNEGVDDNLSSKNSSNFISSSKLKKNKSSTRLYKMDSIPSLKDTLHTNVYYWNKLFLKLLKNFVKISQNYGILTLILLVCFCFGLTLASKECQGTNYGN